MVPAGGTAVSTLETGILAFRWAAVAWMLALTVTGRVSFARPTLAVGAVLATAGWVAALSWTAIRGRRLSLWIDLLVSVALLAVSAFVVPRGTVDDRSLFAAAYPFAAAVGWGAAWGVRGGLASGAVLAAVYVSTRPLNGVPLSTLASEDLQAMATGAVNFVIAGGAVGMVSRLLRRSAAEVREATAQAIAAREHAARLVEREALARTIHDSVLQSLALIRKRAREAADRGGEHVGTLAELAARQERELRALILRDPEAAPAGATSLREALEAAASDVPGVSPVVSAVGAIWVPSPLAEAVTGAAREALVNAAKHAEAGRTTVFAAIEDGHVVVAVRDDGRGFNYDEHQLRASRRAGMLHSMKGRIEDLGGTMRVETAPGRGTEVEFRVPLGAA